MASAGSSSEPSKRVAILGQKDALARALCDLVQLKQGRDLEVIVLLPAIPKVCLPGISIEDLCGAFGFPWRRCVQDKQVFAVLESFQPDLIVSILWPRRLQEDVLGLCSDCINFHPSLLPRHRGSMTQFWAIYEGDSESGTTCHRMVHEFDAGRIIHQVAIALAPDETALSLNLKMVGAIQRCFQHVIRLFLGESGLPLGRIWNVREFPYRKKAMVNDGIIDPEWPHEQIERFIRAMFLPPHEPALAVTAEDGVCHRIYCMHDYVKLRDRATLRGSRILKDPKLEAASSRIPKTGGTHAAAGSSSSELQMPPSEVRRASASSSSRQPLTGFLPIEHDFAMSDFFFSFLKKLLQTSQWPPCLVLFLAGVTGAVMSMAWSAVSESDNNKVVYDYGPDARRFTLADFEAARCLDGSPANYYLSPAGSAVNRSKFVIYFQGGGWCTENASQLQDGYNSAPHIAHPSLCTDRAKGYLGSSDFDVDSKSFRGAGKGYLSGDPLENPMMHDWNRVLVRNCDGTAFLGSLKDPKGKPDAKLHFRGRDIAMATIDSLLQSHGLDTAKEVILAGCSAGAVAATILADSIKSTLRKRATKKVFVAVLADSGVFPAWPEHEAGPPRGVLAFPQFDWMFTSVGASDSAAPACLEDKHGASCLRLGTALRYSKTPTFVTQSYQDTWHFSEEDPSKVRSESARALAARIDREIRSHLPEKFHGGILDGCFRHCQCWGQLRFGNESNRDIFYRWYQTRLQEWRATVAGQKHGVEEIWHFHSTKTFPNENCPSSPASFSSSSSSSLQDDSTN
mmetsp:Transcript_2926/g.6375  ORF Transcript_2926/g.6375 Transcript_2926/m.6375 type:complete len:795 (+) Transcript_2926:31-2415(+)